jgi:hypothetical protein
MFELRLCDSPLIYYPTNPGRKMRRIAMFDGEMEIAFVDLFVESDWAHFIYVWVHPDYRDENTIWHYISNAFNFDLGTKNIYWLNIVQPLVHFLHKIADERPDLVFAATGATDIVLNG